MYDDAAVYAEAASQEAVLVRSLQGDQPVMEVIMCQEALQSARPSQFRQRLHRSAPHLHTLITSSASDVSLGGSATATRND
jgi:hypothetical protein